MNASTRKCSFLLLLVLFNIFFHGNVTRNVEMKKTRAAQRLFRLVGSVNVKSYKLRRFVHSDSISGMNTPMELLSFFFSFSFSFTDYSNVTQFSLCLIISKVRVGHRTTPRQSLGPIHLFLTVDSHISRCFCERVFNCLHISSLFAV